MKDLEFSRFSQFIREVSKLKITEGSIRFGPTFLFDPSMPSVTIKNVGRMIPPETLKAILEEMDAAKLQGGIMNGELVFYPEGKPK